MIKQVGNIIIFRSIVLGIACCLFTSFVANSQTTLTVSNKEGKPLSNIIVEITLLSLEKPSEQAQQLAYSSNAPDTVKVEQKDQQFVPHISVVATGTNVIFPNADNVQHHVYSFSPAKTFEVSLREEFTSAPIMFEEPGIVELGCNIHDWMLAYVYVSDAQWFGQTNNQGELKFDFPLGEYKVSLWHPRLSHEDIKRDVTINVANTTGAFSLNLTSPLLPSFTGYDTVEAVDEY